ncbi:MAG TPA: hypothetical protein VFA77_02635 [Candidatus Eisenbacteria bacterium]|nr:hypothetical protein [Candidatus Eisenbacteria bacterium]
MKKLLTLKRHEQPPPGYFAEFPRRVRARLEREPSLPALPWWQRLGLSFELTPALACSFGVLVCGMLLTGVVYSFQDAPPPQVFQPAAGNFSTLAITSSMVPVSAGLTLQGNNSDAANSSPSVGTPAFPNFLFNGQSLAAPVSYSPGNN